MTTVTHYNEEKPKFKKTNLVRIHLDPMSSNNEAKHIDQVPEGISFVSIVHDMQSKIADARS